MNLVRQAHSVRLVDDPLARFSRGEISRQQAMQELGTISYGELLDRISARALPLPRVSKEQEDAMVERLDAVLARR